MKKTIFIFSLCAIFSLSVCSSAFAAGNLQNARGNLTPAVTGAGYSADQGDIGNITGQIINVALSMVGIIFLGLMVYAGYLWMTAQGEDTQIEKAKKIISSAIIGLVLTMSAYAITALVTTKFSAPAADPEAAAAAACNAREGKVWLNGACTDLNPS